MAGSGEINIGSTGSFINLTGANAMTVVTPSQNIAVTCDPVGSPVPLGQVALGQSKTGTCTIRNDGTSDLTVSALTASGSVFSLVSPPTLPLVLQPGAQQAVQVAFAPRDRGVHSGTLTIGSDDGDQSSLAVPFSGEGIAVLSLVAGWNFVSLPAMPHDKKLLVAFQDLIGDPQNSDVEIIWGYYNDGTNQTWSFYNPLMTVQTLTDVYLGRGYWIKMKTARTLTIN